MYLNIKKYESINIYVLLQNNIIIGMYKTFDDASAAAKQLVQKNKDPYKHKDDWIKL